ncbi:MAG: hypothetical protein IID41_11495 [Planctomycetes bacterium]|nr:hypothetical protein [Planctomycetota bacterium]
MSELADLNAKIDRLNRKLKADPITIVAAWPWVDQEMLAIRPRDPEWQLWATCRHVIGTFHGGVVTIVLADNGLRSRISCEIEAVIHQDNYESMRRTVKLFARKIQLAILERLTNV